jgi:hypothetical protein
MELIYFIGFGGLFMKRHTILFLSVLMALMMACGSGPNGESDATTEIPTDIPPTKTPVAVVEESPTTSAFSFEEANAGAHHYWMTPFENGCEASEDSNTPKERDKEHTFAADFSSVTYSGREYVQVGDHRYQSINENDKPLILEYSEDGFVLNVYNEGDNPNINEPCLYFDFALQE